MIDIVAEYDPSRTKLESFIKSAGFLNEFARLFEMSFSEGQSTMRTKALRRLCKSQLTDVRHSLNDLLTD